MHDLYPFHSIAADDLLIRQALVWSQVCQVAEGLAIAPAIHCLTSRCGHPSQAVSHPDANPGFVAVALRALMQQGRLAEGQTAAVADPTGGDWAWRDAAGLYAQVPGLIVMAGALMRGDGAAESGGPCADNLCQGVSGPANGTLPGRIATELLGFLAAPLMLRLADNGKIPPFQPVPCPLPPDALPSGPGGRQGAWALRRLGWLAGPEAMPVLTVEGRMAVSFSGQFRYPLSYLPMLARMDDLLFGNPEAALNRGADDRETHLDRAADIRFSTEVFERNCAPSLLSMALPLFHREHGARRPTVVVDTGCGEATLLAALFRAIQTTPTTADIASELMLVGVENNPVAEQAARRTLAASGAKWLVLAGDITHPEGIACALRAHGIDAAEVLHVGKSVIHDRELVEETRPAAAGPASVVDGVFARPDGTLVDVQTAHRDLVRFFERWRPYLGRHGMIALEPHALNTTIAATLSGRSLTAVMEALHGFSCQYLCTAEHFAQAVEAAGLDIVRRCMIGSPLTGHDHMSCSHLIARQ